MTKKVELFSGKVLKVPSNQVSANRYKWIKLAEAEPDLGVPAVSGAFVYSDTDGARSWTTNLRTDVDGNLFTGNRIQSSVAGQDLEIGTTDDATLNVRITSSLVVEGDIVINGSLIVNVELTELKLADGASVFIGPDEVLNQTTLGPTVIISSLEQVGTITVGTWEADPIQPAYGGTGLAGVTPNAVLFGDGTNPMKETKGDPFQVLQVDATGTPTFAGLDYGRF